MVTHGMVEFKDEENRECEKRGMGKKRLQRLGHRPPRHHSPRNQHFQKVFVRKNWASLSLSLLSTEKGFTGTVRKQTVERARSEEEEETEAVEGFKLLREKDTKGDFFFEVVWCVQGISVFGFVFHFLLHFTFTLRAKRPKSFAYDRQLLWTKLPSYLCVMRPRKDGLKLSAWIKGEKTIHLFYK